MTNGLIFTASDEELFEDNPEEYIRRDIEGSDVETRRRAVSDLVRTLSQHFEAKIVELFGGYLTVLLDRYSKDPKNNWRSKNTAIYLVTTLASKGATQKMGVTQTSQLVPLPQFCVQHVITELERADVNELPVLKADALKFLMTFRSLLGPTILHGALPQIIRHLQSDSYVLHSYAACNIERLLILKDASGSPVVPQAVLAPFSNELINSLFAALQKPGSAENEYIMKAIMRSIGTLSELSMPFMGVVLPKLTEILTLVSKNPSKPHFNHYLFETLSLSTKTVCKVEPNAVTAFEEVLFPIFQHILQEDIMGKIDSNFYTTTTDFNNFLNFRIFAVRLSNAFSVAGSERTNRERSRSILGPPTLPIKSEFVGTSSKHYSIDPTHLQFRSFVFKAHSRNAKNYGNTGRVSENDCIKSQRS